MATSLSSQESLVRSYHLNYFTKRKFLCLDTQRYDKIVYKTDVKYSEGNFSTHTNPTSFQSNVVIYIKMINKQEYDNISLKRIKFLTIHDF